MSTYYVKGNTSPVRLTNSDFVAKGGEKSIYAKGGTAYCVYHNVRNAMPVAKIRELSAINHPAVVVPTAELMNGKRARCGEVMPFVEQSYSPKNVSVKPLVLCQLFTNGFRRKHGVTELHIGKITDAMLEVMRTCHANGVTMVDPNESNWLVRYSFDSVYLIDTSCMQTSRFRGTAIKPAIRDYSQDRFSEQSDYLSLAVVLGWLWVGIHPYLAFHPDWEHMDANAAMVPRMKSHFSFFRDRTEFNRACRSLLGIPGGLRQWLQAVLNEGQRVAPPNSCGEVAAVAVMTTPPVHAEGDTVRLDKICDAAADIVGVYGDEIVTAQDDHVIVFTPVLGKAVMVAAKQRLLSLGTHDSPIRLQVRANAVFTSGGRAYVVSDTSVSEVLFNELGGEVRATIHKVGGIADLPTTKTWPGCVIQNLLGKYLVSVFPESGKCYQHQLPDLEGWQILDAQYDNGVLVVCAESGGQYKMVAHRFKGDSQDSLLIGDETGDVNFAVTDRGVCALLEPGGTLRLFSNRVGSNRVERKSFPSPDAILLSQGHKIVAAIGTGLYDVVL